MNTASRMESTSLAGRIQLSSATHSLLSHCTTFAWEERKAIQVKGKGTMKTFLLKHKTTSKKMDKKSFKGNLTYNGSLEGKARQVETK